MPVSTIYPLSASLGVTDSLDGTGTITVAGTLGCDWRVFRMTWSGRPGAPDTWESETTGTGDGTFSVDPGPGFYFWQLLVDGAGGTLGDLTAPVYRPIANPADPIHSRCIDALVTLIRSLNLSGIGSDANKVFKRWFPTYVEGIDAVAAGGGGLPQIQVGLYPKEAKLGILTGHDDVGYPALVGFFDQANARMDNNMPRYLKWRQQVAAAVRSQRLAGVNEIVVSDWEPDLICSPDGLAQNYLVGSILFWFRSRETRGLIP